MEQHSLNYTLINHSARKVLGISMNDYAVADSIYQLSNNPKSQVVGWCYARKDIIADFLGIGRATVFRSIETLVELGLVEENEGNKSLVRTTVAWYDIVIISKRDDNLSMRSVESQNETESSLKMRSLYNKDKDNKDKSNKDIEEASRLLAHWNNTYQTKFKTPAAIVKNVSYWLTLYSIEEIQKAVVLSKNDKYWGKILTPEMFFRKKNPRGEDVDRIGSFLNATESKEFENAGSGKYDHL